MNDWRDLPDGEALDRLIAERLGWRAVDLNDNPGGARVRGPNWQILTPAGGTKGWGWNELQAWEHADLPDYSADLNAAVTLVQSMDGFTLYVDAFWGGYGTPFMACIPDGDGGHCFEAADTPALAVCRAFLSYWEAKQAVTP